MKKDYHLELKSTSQNEISAVQNEQKHDQEKQENLFNKNEREKENSDQNIFINKMLNCLYFSV